MMTVFLPCRAGSERVPNKNTKDFAGIKGGLLYHKLNQLINIETVDRIVLSSNDDKVFEVAKLFKSPKLVLDRRPDEYANSNTSTDDLISYVAKLFEDENTDILWTHVTSPFIDEKIYAEAIDTYHSLIDQKEYDSLMSVNILHSFLWNEKAPINYDRKKEKWPRTQTIDPVFEINSGIFIAPNRVYSDLGDRIGKTPFLMTLDKFSSFDIDWEEEFQLAEMLYKQKEND